MPEHGNSVYLPLHNRNQRLTRHTSRSLVKSRRVSALAGSASTRQTLHDVPSPCYFCVTAEVMMVSPDTDKTTRSPLTRTGRGAPIPPTTAAPCPDSQRYGRDKSHRACRTPSDTLLCQPGSSFNALTFRRVTAPLLASEFLKLEGIRHCWRPSS